MPKNELIISCYNNAHHLRLVLQSVLNQSVLPDAICFSDEGSTEETISVINDFIARGDIPSRHIWQEDFGFRKTRVLNNSIKTSDADYLVFVDGDCILHPDFLKRHLDAARKGRFLTGSVIRLNPIESDNLLKAGSIVWSKEGYLKGWHARGLSNRLKAGRLNGKIARLLERLSPVRTSWSGGHASAFKKDILSVNGFDETMGYGAEDKEFGTLLTNSGIRGRQVRYSAPLYHIEHTRDYYEAEVYWSNRDKLLATRRNKKIWAEFGISHGDRVEP